MTGCKKTNAKKAIDIIKTRLLKKAELCLVIASLHQI